MDVLLQHFLSIKMFIANNFLSLVASDCPLLAYIWCKTSFGILWQFLKDHETIWSQTGAIQHNNSLNERMAGPSQFFYFLLFFQLHIIIYKVYFSICPTAIEMMYVCSHLFICFPSLLFWQKSWSHLGKSKSTVQDCNSLSHFCTFFFKKGNRPRCAIHRGKEWR